MSLHVKVFQKNQQVSPKSEAEGEDPSWDVPTSLGFSY